MPRSPSRDAEAFDVLVAKTNLEDWGYEPFANAAEFKGFAKDIARQNGGELQGEVTGYVFKLNPEHLHFVNFATVGTRTGPLPIVFSVLAEAGSDGLKILPNCAMATLKSFSDSPYDQNPADFFLPVHEKLAGFYSPPCIGPDRGGIGTNSLLRNRRRGGGRNPALC